MSFRVLREPRLEARIRSRRRGTGDDPHQIGERARLRCGRHDGRRGGVGGQRARGEGATRRGWSAP